MAAINVSTIEICFAIYFSRTNLGAKKYNPQINKQHNTKGYIANNIGIAEEVRMINCNTMKNTQEEEC